MSLTVGILTLYVGRNKIEERQFLAACVREGAKLQLDVIIFTPQDVQRKQGPQSTGTKMMVRAHLYDWQRKRWRRGLREMPPVIYDRCRYQPGSRFRQLKWFRQRFAHLLYLNHPLGHKGRVQQVLEGDREIARYLPETKALQAVHDVITMSKKYADVYLKPVNGTGGRGIMRLRCSGSGNDCSLEGRNALRRIYPKISGPRAFLCSVAQRRMAGQRYLVQQGIDVRTTDGRVHDFRLVVQKNGHGKWSLTGGAARIGRTRSVTSNLHGGGQAVSLDTMLLRTFSKDKAKQIKERMESMGLRIAERLEAHYGRLCELALDIAVDRKGHPWLLEINPKPAREIFARTGQQQTYRTAIRRPFEFARWLYERKQGEVSKRS